MRNVSPADVIFAVAGVLLSIFVLVQANGMSSTSTFAKVPPNIFPWMIGIGLLIVGLLLLLGALRGDKAEPAGEEDADADAPTNYLAIVFVAGGLLLQILFINLLGFIITSSLMFAGTAQGFRLLPINKRARAFGTDFLIGAVVSIIAYLGFTKGLGIQLPAGLLPF